MDGGERTLAVLPLGNPITAPSSFAARQKGHLESRHVRENPPLKRPDIRQEAILLVSVLVKVRQCRVD